MGRNLNQQPESISSVLIRVEPGYQIDEVKENLCLAFEEAGLDCNKILMESSSELLRKATDTFSKFAGYYLELYGKDYNKTWLVT